ncbi:MAG: hypothetical protein H7A23_20845 [Leptospiraceae bacterium]|nr:hypothetical protein [Leptospiraceae bacterium]MCP5497010.1 hypothetical protein [Leptospiraceae bacterium]
MKKIACILVLTLSFHNCKTEKKTVLDKFLESAALLYRIDGLLYINVCPPKNATLGQGITTISLKEGEEYWFDVNTITPSRFTDLKVYDVGFIELSGKTLDIGNPNCMKNRQIYDPTPAKVGGMNQSTNYKDGFWIYGLFFDNNRLANVKSKSGSGEIQIKVP